MGINEIYTLCRFTFDSKMDTNLDKERAKERKGEILHTFERMIMYAVQNDISSILIAGDMFDVKNISATARNVVLYNIVGHPEITFYYLRGNHDNDNFLSGMELSRENAESAYTSLVLDSKKFKYEVVLNPLSKIIIVRSDSSLLLWRASAEREIPESGSHSGVFPQAFESSDSIWDAFVFASCRLFESEIFLSGFSI